MTDFFNDKLSKAFIIFSFALMPLTTSALNNFNGSLINDYEIDGKNHSKVIPQKDVNGKFFDAVISGNHVDVLNALNNGAHINYMDMYGSALHRAIARHFNDPCIKIIHALINNGISLDAVDHRGNTALHTALFLEVKQQLEVITILLRAGASTRIKNKNGGTPLHYAVDGGLLDAVKVLVKKRAGIPTLDGLAIFTEYSGVNELDDKGWGGPLHKAAYRGNEEMVKVLIEAGANLELRSRQGITALRMAAQMEHKNIVEILIKAGADINTQCKLGFTPYLWAINRRKMEMAQLLRDLGAKTYFVE